MEWCSGVKCQVADESQVFKCQFVRCEVLIDGPSLDGNTEEGRYGGPWSTRTSARAVRVSQVSFATIES
ncbi:hypothetical protein E2C01_043895 [Portunus trituberculatus]|uniref:Uncharacterized protein n=1 Tax=Portunus trituberculatus TaxID=210409 RepID=A0A5B7FYI8_PORTR|nr:hypothetical protein [Portunus trituberculatus]